MDFDFFLSFSDFLLFYFLSSSLKMEICGHFCLIIFAMVVIKFFFYYCYHHHFCDFSLLYHFVRLSPIVLYYKTDFEKNKMKKKKKKTKQKKKEEKER